MEYQLQLITPDNQRTPTYGKRNKKMSGMEEVKINIPDQYFDIVKSLNNYKKQQEDLEKQINYIKVQKEKMEEKIKELYNETDITLIQIPSNSDYVLCIDKNNIELMKLTKWILKTTN
jgi:hypothetical protein